ncbi:serine/threonine-protein kinase RIO1-like [Macrobrachium nipponense]|uniref:serine/threonine-protein kinase RIO1-like n=1 Tax=Macrobrachium nipponense TaxID=159736 RepID=UPI0030C8341B
MTKSLILKTAMIMNMMTLLAMIAKISPSSITVNLERVLVMRIAQSQKIEKFQPSEKLFKKYDGKICLEKLEGLVGFGGNVTNKISESQRRAENERQRVRDKSERATVEQVLDPRTRMILFKLLNKGTISEINGCISTGKEANVYHATNAEGKEFAVKVYKTSVLTFKARDQYVSGDHR